MSEYSRMITMSEKTLREMLKDIADGAAYEGKHWQFCNHYRNVDDEDLGGEITDVIERFKDNIQFEK